MIGSIYQIHCLSNGRRYIGSTVNLKRRWSVHFSEFRRGIHHNRQLQRAWKKYGETGFVFEVLELVLEGDLLLAEQNWLDIFQPEFNATWDARAGMTGKTHSPEARRKISERRITPKMRADMSNWMKGNKNALGCKRSDETKAKMRAALYARLARKAA